MKVSLPVTYEEFEENAGGMIDDENEDGMVGAGVDTFADGSYDFSNEEVNEEISTSPYDQSFEAPMDEAPNAMTMSVCMTTCIAPTRSACPSQEPSPAPPTTSSTRAAPPFPSTMGVRRSIQQRTSAGWVIWKRWNFQ